MLRRAFPASVLLVLLFLASAASTRADGPVFPDPAERLRLLSGHRTLPAEFFERGAGLRIPEDDYDVRYSSLDIDITDTANHRIQGKAAHTVASNVPSLSQVVLNLVNSFTVDSVRVNGQPATFTHSSNLVRVNLPVAVPIGQTVRVRVAYQGSPPQSDVGMRFDQHLGQPFVWTLSEPDGSRYWWPCKDHPDDKADSADIRIKTPTSMVATSVGKLVATDLVPGGKVYNWHCSYPIASYLISVTAGDFVALESVYPIPGGGTMPLMNYVFPEQSAQADIDFDIAVPAIDAYAERFGPYPFLREKYGITVFGWGGAMEHQTNTSYGWFLINGQHTYDWIYVHELTHQWFGDNITCATWADCWLNEGFASWGEAVWMEDRFGFNAYRDYMVNSQPVSDPSGPVYNFPDPFDGNTIYNKGSWVVHMLRGVLGDVVFYDGMSEYRNLYQGRSVTTEQLRAVFEAVSGRDLSWFFNEWVYGMNRPDYVLSSMTESIPNGVRCYIHLDQSQTDAGFFTMPVRFVVAAGGLHNFTFWNDPDHDDLVVDLLQAPSAIQLDPDRWILRTLANGPYGLNLVSADLPDAAVDDTVQVPLVARGGTQPYAWQTVDAPPAGIALDPVTGVLHGVPQAAGDYAFRVRVLDSAVPARADTARLFWTINPSTVGVGDPVAASYGFSVLRATPNPSAGAVLVSWTAAVAGEVEWSAFDLAGRRVADARTTAVPGREIQTWQWDRRDRFGNPLPSGVYWVQARRLGADGVPAVAREKVCLIE